MSVQATPPPAIRGADARAVAVEGGAVAPVAEAPLERFGSIEELQRSITSSNASIRDALRGGQLVERGLLGASGITGPPMRVEITGTDGVGLAALSKLHDHPYAEELATGLAERMGIGHLLVPTVERDGKMVIKFVDALQGREAGLDDADALEAQLRTFYEQRLVGVPADQIAKQARIERQLIQTFDHGLAIADRHKRNIMVERASERPLLIDHSALLLGHHPEDPLVPTMMRTYMQDGHYLDLHQEVQLDAETRALLAERVPAGTVEGMLADLRARPGFAELAGPRLADTAAADSIATRIAGAIETGVLHYRQEPVQEFLFGPMGDALNDHRWMQGAMEGVKQLHLW
ncbi:MAG: hypothetical protein JWM98_1162 [Thermoleophilia bacterium]|nr:hypothetical protein [Thermoleophilia bacterium]